MSCPTAGIESWVEIHNAPAETENLVQLLWHLKGVDILTAQFPGQTNRFIVMNSKGERAIIDWNPAKNSFRYSTESGRPASTTVRWSSRSPGRTNSTPTALPRPMPGWRRPCTNHYPLALERIARGLTRNAQSCDHSHQPGQSIMFNAGWLVKKAAELVTFGSTHGALDDLNSDGILLSNFAPTPDTSSGRVAGLFDGFPGCEQLSRGGKRRRMDLRKRNKP